jgi:hypothetical protein
LGVLPTVAQNRKAIASVQALSHLLPAKRAYHPRPDDSWKKLYRYWLAKHDDGRPASPHDIDPVREIPQLVANLTLVDIVADGYSYRLLGSTVVDRMGVEMTGWPFGTSGHEPMAIRELRITRDSVSAQLKPYQLDAQIDNQSTAQNNLLIVPLVSAGNQIEMILFSSFYNEYFRAGTRIAGFRSKIIQL